MNVVQAIKESLREKLEAVKVEVLNESHKHKGHAEAKKSGGGHFAVTVISEKFRNKSLIERHRLIYKAVEPLKSKIHALSIKAEAP